MPRVPQCLSPRLNWDGKNPRPVCKIIIMLWLQINEEELGWDPPPPPPPRKRLLKANSQSHAISINFANFDIKVHAANILLLICLKDFNTAFKIHKRR